MRFLSSSHVPPSLLHTPHPHSISLCRYGGPIALLRDDRKLVRVQTGADARPLVRTYSAAGARLAEWEWDGGLVAGMGWTDEEDLCVVSVSGGAKLYTPLADEPPRTLTLGSDAFRDGVTKAAFYGSGFVALTGSNALLCAAGAPPSARVAPLSPPPRGKVTALAALPPLPGSTSGGRAVVAVASEEGGGGPSSLATCDAGGTIVVATSPSPYAHVAASPCGGFVAAVTDDGRLTVWGASFGAPLSEFAAAGGATPPTGLAWCGADSVLLLWPGLALMVGPYGDWVKFETGEDGGGDASNTIVAAVSDADGARLVTRTTHALIRRVPDELAATLAPGSTAACATLADARRALDAGDAAGAARLRGLARRSLPRAAAWCAAAAAASLKPRQQSELLKAAVLGVSFALGGGTEEEGGGGDDNAAAADCDDAALTDPTAGQSLTQATRTAARAVASTVARLRVLRAAREASVGLPLTAAQAHVLGDEPLVARLARRRHHALALKAAALLRVPGGPVAAHWAAAVIASPAAAGVPDGVLAARLTGQLSAVSGVRYGALASSAAAAGRRALAADLLAAEPDAAARVPLLLRLGDGARALNAALKAGDADLIGSVVTGSRNDDRVRAGVRASAAARAVVELDGIAPDPTDLDALLGPAAAANARAVTALASSAAHALTAVTARRAAGASRAERDAAAASASALDAAASHLPTGSLRSALATEGAALRRLQLSLEASTGHAMLVGLSAADTAAALLAVVDEAAALQVKTKAGLSDKRFAWLRARHAIAAKDWDAVDVMVATAGKKGAALLPPDAVAAAAKAAGAPTTVLAKLIARMPDGVSKMEALAALGLGGGASSSAATTPRPSADLRARVAGLVEGGTGALWQLGGRFGFGGAGG